MSDNDYRRWIFMFALISTVCLVVLTILTVDRSLS